MLNKNDKVKIIATRFPEHWQWVGGKTATVKRFIKSRGLYLIELDDQTIEPVMWEMRETSLERVQP